MITTNDIVRITHNRRLSVWVVIFPKDRQHLNKRFETSFRALEWAVEIKPEAMIIMDKPWYHRQLGQKRS